MGMALAAGFKGANTRVLRTTVRVVVVLMMLMLGSMTASVLVVLQIAMGVEDEGEAVMRNGTQFCLGQTVLEIDGLRGGARAMVVWGDGDDHHGTTFIQMEIVELPPPPHVLGRIMVWTARSTMFPCLSTMVLSSLLRFHPIRIQTRVRCCL
jgi:hypothetical protein